MVSCVVLFYIISYKVGTTGLENTKEQFRKENLSRTTGIVMTGQMTKLDEELNNDLNLSLGKADSEKEGLEDEEVQLNENKEKPIENVVSKPASESVKKKTRPTSIEKYGLIFYPPVEYKLDRFGRMVCIHDNDKPSISDKDKPVHKDMQCCLDPDEIPNPYCYYPPEKYGKILEDFERKKEKMLRRHRAGEGI